MIFSQRHNDPPLSDLTEQQEAHTLRIGTTVGMANPVTPDRDTSTITIDYTPFTLDFGYATTNCYSGWWPADNRSEEEKRQAWREYWQRVVRWPGTTPYSKRESNPVFRSFRRHANIPCLAEVRKKALSPAVHAHRRFMARMMKPVRPLV